MKKIITWIATAVCCMAFGALPASAKALFSDDFAYPAEELVGQGSWLNFYTRTTDPIKLVEPALSYPGYQDEATGLSVALVPGSSTSKCAYKLWGTYNDRILDGTIYVSVLMNVSNPGADSYCFGMIGMSSTTAGVDGKSGDDKCRIFTNVGSSSDKYKIGVSKNNSTGTYIDGEFNIGETYLVVLKYEFVSGPNNDVASIWVNPETEAEPTSGGASINAAADANTTNGLLGVYFRQGGNSGKSGATVKFDALRAATTWGELFSGEQGGGDDPVPTDAALSVDKTSLEFQETYQGLSQTMTLTLKGVNLTGTVSATATGAGFSVEPETITAEEAMSETGATVTVKFSAPNSGAATGQLTFRSAGAEDLNVPLSCTVNAVSMLGNSMFVQNNAGDGSVVYRYGGSATVTFVDKAANRVYAQDVVGGICFDFSMFELTCPLSVNDKVKDVYGLVLQDETTHANTFVPVMDVMTITSGATPKEPLELSASELKSAPENYIFRLVKISDEVEFINASEGENFSTRSLQAVSGETQFNVMPFPATDLIGQAIPAKATSVAGISFSAQAATVRPRSLADVEMAAADTPTLSVTAEKLLTEEYAAINSTYPFAKLTVTTANLTHDVRISLTGNSAAMYSIDTNKIPAGSGTYTLTVSYTPTAIGTHEASVNIDATPTDELSTAYTLRAAAIDPQNPPTVSVDTSGLTELNASVGTSVTQELQVVTANMPAYGSIKLTKASGVFRLNNTSLINNVSNRIVITFSPTAAGTFVDELEISAPGGNTIKVPLQGVASGDTPPEDVEGDELILDTSAPLTYLVEEMNSAVSNKPIAIDGWKNVAVKGTRAWWGQAFTAEGNVASSPDDVVANRAAKVSAYDFFATEDSPAEMLLITPALNFKDTEAKFLTFRVMGENLSDETPTDPLNIWYLEKGDTEVYTESLSIPVPTTSDQNKTWNEYIVDLDGLELPDVMFIGFDFQSQRGKNSSVIWYVDDVTWGRSDIPFIRPIEKTLTFTTPPSTDFNHEFEVVGLNLTEPISLKMVGSHAAAYTLSTTELPKEGGKFTVTFNSATAGEEHIAYVELKSASAPISYIELYGTPSTESGIDSLATDTSKLTFTTSDGVLRASGAAVSRLTLYAISGTLCGSVDGNEMGIAHLAPGVYIATATLPDGSITTSKVAIR